MRRGEEEARGLRKEEAEVVLRKPGGSCAEKWKLQFFEEQKRSSQSDRGCGSVG